MDDSLFISNDGPEITNTNYWASGFARSGKIIASINAGSIRLLLPPNLYQDTPDMIAAKSIVVSRGFWAAMGRRGVEVLFDDDSISPYALHLEESTFDVLPEIEEGEWRLSVWVESGGVPNKILDRSCHLRKVPVLPCLKPI
jgi:hypothetical protein